MASTDGSMDSPRNPSFAIRDDHFQKNSTIPRSVSVKDLSFSEFFTCSSPPRFSFQHPHTTFPSTQFNNNTDHKTKPGSSCRCIHSVFKKIGGHVLSIAVWSHFVHVGSDTNQIRIWKLPEFKECGQIKIKVGMVVAVEVVNDRVYAAYGDGKIRVWRSMWDGTVRHVRLGTIPRTKGSVLRYISGKSKMNKHTAPITSLAVNLTDDVLYSASLDKTVKVWRLSDFECVESIPAHAQPINAIVVSSNGVLYTASDDATIGVWRRNFYRGDQCAHALTKTLQAKNSPVKTLTLAPTTSTPSYDSVLYAGCTDGYVHYWTTGWFQGRQMQYGGALHGHTHAVMCVASVANYVVSGSADSTCRVWTRDDDGQHVFLAVLAGQRGPLRCVAVFSGRFEEGEEEDGCTICTGSLDGVLEVWRVTRVSNSDRRLSQKSLEDFEFS